MSITLSSATRIPFPGEPASASEHVVVERQLGRPPRGEVSVSARCGFGLPMVVRTAPVLDDGTPFPTLFYLTCPVAVRAIGRLEATGEMERMRDLLATDAEVAAAYAEAHERFLAMRDSIAVLPERASAGGMPGRVKCLHALYAHELGDANPIGARTAAAVADEECPAPCVVGGERAPDHPGFSRKRRRH